MVARTHTVAFQGIDARLIEVQCALSPGVPGFAIVGLPDKAVTEARERVKSALIEMQVALPSKRITVNLSPADLPKTGSHFDLPIALSVLSAIGVLPEDSVAGLVSLGELSLSGALISVPGVLPSALATAEAGLTLLCPAACSAEAAWVPAAAPCGAETLGQIVSHLNGKGPLPPAEPGAAQPATGGPCLSDVRGQARAKRALEIAAAGRHHLMMVGPPGSGKSMLAQRLPGILPPLRPEEALESSMIHSLAGHLGEGGLLTDRPFCDPHHTASQAAIVGGGKGARPGQVSLAHHGVLFMDELPEFSRNVLNSLRQPIETGEILIARAQANMRYPSRFLLVAAANPCRCGYLADAGRACGRAPACGQDYLGRVSGPLMDRFDLRIELPPVAISDLDRPPDGERSETVRARVKAARDRQADRFQDIPGATVNADAGPDLLDRFARPDDEGRRLLARISDKFSLTARGYHRLLRVARTIADLSDADQIAANHIAEAASFRVTFLSGH
ncbi:MAG: AAA family ATPase [Rhodobacterales bacterium]|nr:MAG: AAA family ATPase [Rhodobacterales bacterium]